MSFHVSPNAAPKATTLTAGLISALLVAPLVASPASATPTSDTRAAAPGGSVTVEYAVQAKRAHSLLVQRKTASGWRTQQVQAVKAPQTTTVTLPAAATSSKWRVAVTSAAGSVLSKSRVTTVRPVNIAARVSQPPVVAEGGDWLSGASGDGVADGSFGAWRGTPVEIAGTWNDSLEAQTEQWTMLPGFEFGSWQNSIDVAVGGIYRNQGESWAAAATGAYDARWSKALTKLKTLWGTKPGTVYIRFAHEFNGSWVPWYVTGTETASFIKAWKRFRALQRQIFPSSKLVFCPNDGSSSSLKLDWRKAFPTGYVDVLSVDSYNQYPFVTTAAEFDAKILMKDAYGAPVGIERHRQFAQAKGLPFAVSEWSSNSSMGDSAVYVSKFRQWVGKNAGSGAGQVLYEILFNVGNFNSGVFQMYPATKMTQASQQYVTSF